MSAFSGHTPGPWRVDVPENGDADFGEDCDLHEVATLKWGMGCRLEDEALANARLIAAAPDLLAFKLYVHARLDEAGVPADPQPGNACSIGARLDWLLSRPR